MHTLDGYPFFLEESNGFQQKAGGGIGVLLLVSRQVSHPSKLIDSGILKQSLSIGAAGTRNNLDVNLYTLARIDRLLVRLGLIRWLLRPLR